MAKCNQLTSLPVRGLNDNVPLRTFVLVRRIVLALLIVLPSACKQRRQLHLALLQHVPFDGKCVNHYEVLFR